MPYSLQARGAVHDWEGAPLETGDREEGIPRSVAIWQVAPIRGVWSGSARSSCSIERYGIVSVDKTYIESPSPILVRDGCRDLVPRRVPYRQGVLICANVPLQWNSNEREERDKSFKPYVADKVFQENEPSYR